MKSNKLLSDIDFLLAKLEDYTHGKDGKEITKMRGLIASEIKNQHKLSLAIKEIENSMERWHMARDNDDETLNNINDTLVKIGLLGFFNKTQ